MRAQRRRRVHFVQRDAVLKWAFEQGKRVLFLPDQHLGRNTALKMGVPLDEMVVWNPFRNMGGNTRSSCGGAKMVLCRAIARFTQDSQ